MGAKTVVFGLDGACFELVEPWLAAGDLPTLAGLADRGGSATLRSCVPATTPPAWTSLTTGVNPGKHGVFGFYRREPDSYGTAPVTDRDVRARRLWDYLSERGRRSLVVNVPVTHPAREVAGALVPGYLAPDEPTTHPAGLCSTVGMEDYRVYAPSEAADVPEEGLLAEWLALTDSRRDLAVALADGFEWDLLFVVFQKTDGAVHKFGDRERVRRVYEHVDGCMADVLDAVGGDPNVFVVSDHGIGRPKRWSVALNTWLVEAGYAETTTATGGEESWLEAATGSGGDRSSTVGQVVATLGRVGLTKQRVERALSALGLYDLALRALPAGTGDALASETVDPAASTAFYEGVGFSGVDTGVFLNDDRVYPEGRVSAAAYDAVREELMTALADLTGPDGERAFSRVRPREEVYHGPHVEDAPDIVLEQAPDYVIGGANPRAETFLPTEAGRVDHTRDGLLIAAGPEVADGWSLEERPSVVDVTPTLLALLGIPLAEVFDGDVLDVFAASPAPATREYGPFDPGEDAAVSGAEEAALRDRLRGMGYLE
jgi:predicted AlkP superfamily phosphohydrolase/phosphomutase